MKPDPDKGVEFYIDADFLVDGTKRKVSIPDWFFLERDT